MLNAVWDDTKKWAAQPFRVDMSALEWFAFVGFLIVVMILWRIILNHVTEG